MVHILLGCVLIHYKCHLEVVSGAALSSVALNLERTLEGGGNPEARCDHHVPATIQVRAVVLGVVRAADQAPVYVKKASTP